MSVLSKALPSIVVVTLLSGCAVNNTVVPSDNDALSVKTVAQEQLLEQSNTTITAFELLNTKQIADTGTDGVGVQLDQGQGFSRLTIATGSQEPSLDVLTLKKPPRLVVDLLGNTTKVNRAYYVEDSYVNSIRFGSHDDRLRIVVDLTKLAGNGAKEISHRIDTSTGKLYVTFMEPSLAALPFPKQFSVAKVNTKTTEQLSNSEAPALSPDTTEATVAKTTKEAVTGTIVESNTLSLESLGFQKTGETAGTVSVSLSDKAAFELRQTAPSEYALRIPGAISAEKTRLPLLAPKGVAGIRTVRAVQEKDGTVVRMFVDQGVKLSATVRDNSIIVTPVVGKNISAKSDARAQLADDAGKDAAPEDAGKEAEAEDDDSSVAAEGIQSADGSKIYTGRLISLDLQDTDIDNALRIIAEVSNLNIIASDDVKGKVTLRLIDVPWDQALDVILKTNGLDQVLEGSVIRIAPVDKLRAEREALKEAKRAAIDLEDLQVSYIRISYAKVTDLQEAVESVLTERGTVVADERTNQSIIKDISSGQKDAAELVARLDLRTPQVLLETQIVEASRNVIRDLGFQWGTSYNASPETGNATGRKFPNSVNVGGSASDGTSAWMSNFGASIASDAGSAVTAVLGSVDGSQSLMARLSALESNGKVKVISRPQVATVNNKEAKIKSVETVRVRLPDSGLSVATGSGANASGGGSSAFEEIDVGIELTMTPQASPDYFVLLDIHAQSSTFGTTVVDNIPSTLERTATSTVLVKSGTTFALGGVYRIEDNDSVQGVPFLKDIPVLGHLFRRSNIDKGDEELIFFITPHIVEGSFDEGAM